MSHIRYVTLTGAGGKTSFARMHALSVEFPLVEWAVLYSIERAGKENRYPSKAWLERFAVKAQKARMNIALHLCGTAVKVVLTSMTVPRQERSSEALELIALCDKFDRVQLNIQGNLTDAELFIRLARQLGGNESRTRVILQYFPANAELAKRLAREQEFDILFDSSGGRGVECREWPKLSTETFKRLGFAGGLSRYRIGTALDGISEAYPNRPFWLDMESKIRDENDQLCLEHCWSVLHQTKKWVLAQRRATAMLHPNGRVRINKLKGLWLDWWVGAALGVRQLVVPPLGATAAMYLWQHRGSFERYSAEDNTAEIEAMLLEQKVSFTPVKGGWEASRDGAVLATGEDISEACQRAVVALKFGASVPRQPIVD